MNNDNSINNDFNRIFNGTVVPSHKYPWMVSMQLFFNGYGIHICGGSIISDKTILSAGNNF